MLVGPLAIGDLATHNCWLMIGDSLRGCLLTFACTSVAFSTHSWTMESLPLYEEKEVACCHRKIRKWYCMCLESETGALGVILKRCGIHVGGHHGAETTHFASPFCSSTCQQTYRVCTCPVQ